MSCPRACPRRTGRLDQGGARDPQGTPDDIDLIRDFDPWWSSASRLSLAVSLLAADATKRPQVLRSKYRAGPGQPDDARVGAVAVAYHNIQRYPAGHELKSISPATCARRNHRDPRRGFSAAE